MANGNNLALISTRHMGRAYTALFQPSGDYTFFVDIYATGSLRDLVFSLNRGIVDGLKPFGKKAIASFWNSVKSLQGGITFDPAGNPSFNLQLGDIRSTEATLDEIFRYLEKASRPVIVAIDEFQQVVYYTEKNGSIGITDRYAYSCWGGVPRTQNRRFQTVDFVFAPNFKIQIPASSIHFG